MSTINPEVVWQAILCECVRLTPRLGCLSPEDASIDDLIELLMREVPVEVDLTISFTGSRPADFQEMADRVADLAFIMALTDDNDASFFLSGRAVIALNRLILASRPRTH